MVLCDAVHQDAATGKKTILGTFETVSAIAFPTVARFAVYFAITDADSDFEVEFRIVDSQHAFDANVEPVLSIKVPLHSPSPLAVVEGILGNLPASLPKPGVYHCELLHADEILMSRRLVALDIGLSSDSES